MDTEIKNKKYYLVPIFLFFIFYFSLSSVILAQIPVKQGDIIACTGVDCNFQSLIETAKNVVAKIVLIGLALSPIIIAYGGFLYLTSQNNPNKRTTANGIFKNVAVGLVIMMLAWVLVSLIFSALVCGGVSDGNWFSSSVNCASKTTQ